MRSSSPTKSSVVHIDEASIVNETSPLLSEDLRNKQLQASGDDVEQSSDDASKPEMSSGSVFSILSLLLIGVFVSQADTSLMLATYGEIASEFNNLESGSWLLTSYILAMCVFQPLYGKLSDIFGRKALLQCAYVLFFTGTAICGTGRTMTQIVIGRAIQGVGGAGMVCMVSILLTDIVPLRSVATYRSYVNVVQTVGRSCGGAIGGYLAQTIGWRWTILGQCPLVAISILLVWWRLGDSKNNDTGKAGVTTPTQKGTLSKFKRIDFLGALAMSATILFILLLLELSAANKVWRGYIIGFGIATIVSGFAFWLIEKRFAAEPIFPLRLLGKRAVIIFCTIIAFATATQTSLMFMVPMYVQVSVNASTGKAGAYLIPSIIGNTIGGILTGIWIQRSGTYKLASILASLCAMLCFTLLAIFWSGEISPVYALFIFPGGFATGIAHSAAFVGVTAGVEEDETAIAGGGLYTMSSIGGVVGLAGTDSLFRFFLQTSLARALKDIPKGSKIYNGVLSDIKFIKQLKPEIHDIVAGAFISSFHKIFILCLALSAFTLVLALLIKEKRVGR